MLCSSKTLEFHASYILDPTVSPSACDINATNASNQDPVSWGYQSTTGLGAVFSDWVYYQNLQAREP